jgi:uncharacterized protein YdiU (UPF0061 family)
VTARRQPPTARQSGSESGADASRHPLLRPDRWDRLPIVGVGTSAQVRRWEDLVVKVAHPGPRHRARLRQEAATLEAIGRSPQAGLAPPLVAADDDGVALVRPWVGGAPLEDLLEQAMASEERPPWLGALLRTFNDTEAWRLSCSEQLDFAPPNLLLQPDGRFLLIDAGLRLDPPRFHDLVDEDGLWKALCDYRRWRLAGGGRPLVSLPVMPPSGRFHVDTPVGPVPGAKALYVNEGALRRRRLRLDHAQLTDLCNVATWVDERPRTLPSTRYQDASKKGPGWAAGDGRAVRVGRVAGLDLMAKGCGPTELRWVGNAYHEDGLVSLNRTLWETAVCDELTRLGIPSPEVLAVTPQIGQITVDQTDVPWPAACALRAARHHWRLGHLVHFSDDRGALLDLLVHLTWEGALRDGFDGERVSDLRWLALRFARTLGENTGRCDGLNIQCFNPTMGNVLIDGNFLDFSTIRFMRHYVPDFAYMNAQRRLREVKSAHRLHLGVLVDALRRPQLLSDEQATALERAAVRTYDEHYARGMVRALCTYLGVDTAAADDVSATLCDQLARAWRRLRRARARAFLTFDFWEQRVRAPLFDLEGQLPAFVDAVAGGHAQAWHALRSRFGGDVERQDAEAAAAFERTFRALLNVLPPMDRPRRWEQIVRPSLECERLADLCYRRTRADRMGAFSRTLATSRALPEGPYSWLEGRCEAARLGHVSAPTLGRGAHVVIGLTPELRAGVAQTADDLLEDTLAAVVAVGPRVAPATTPFDEAQVLEERGADERHTTPLTLAVLVTELSDPPDRVAHAFRVLLDAATETLPLALDIVVVGRDAGVGRAAGRAWAEQQGIAFNDAVLVHAPGGIELDAGARLRRELGRASPEEEHLPLTSLQPGDGEAPLDELQLTLALLDDPRCQPRPLPAVSHHGQLRLSGPWSGMLLRAARAAGRTHLVVDRRPEA